MKYTIENNIDFYSELYGSLDDNKNSINEDFCLISNSKLTTNFVELKCGHKFNYGSLYKDIFNHKKKFNNMEQIKTKLKQNQIRCPYCRNIQDELLPYYENFGYPKEHGVNFYDISKTSNNYSDYIDPNNQCQYQIINTDNLGNVHTHQCHHFGYVHSVLQNKYNDGTKYCYAHKLVVVKKFKETIKEDLKNKKLEEKTKKLEEKAKKIEEKNKMKMELIKNKSNQSENSNCCNAILKSGKYKGTYCFVNIYKDSLCKRHYNLNSKESEESEENIVIDKDIKI